MIEILKNKNYTITTSLLANREIQFKEQFDDVEFDEWKISSNPDMLLLAKDGKTLVRLTYDGKYLSGYDVRGGIAELKPQSNMKDKFDAYFKTPRKETLSVPTAYLKRLEIKKTSNIAVLCNDSIENYDTYVPLKDMAETYNQLFEAGYGLVFNLLSGYQKHYLPLLENLSKLLDDKVGSVQVLSKTSGPLEEIQVETGDWKGYAINIQTWAKLRGQMKNHQFNFETNLNKAFKEKELIRYSLVQSRDKNHNLSDFRRKNFKLSEDKSNE